MIEVFITRHNKTSWDVTEMVQSVDWFGKKNRAPRSITVTFVALTSGQHQAIKTTEGEGVFFKWQGKELFQGIIFRHSLSKNGNMQITAHDQMIYLLRNDASRVFKNRTATQIATRLCTDFGITRGSMINTRYVIPTRVYDSMNLYDMILDSISHTHRNSSERFYVMSEKGKLNLILRANQTRLWVIESGSNLIDYNYRSNIDDTSTRVVIEAGEDNKTVIATANNNDLQKQLGILQFYERSTEDLNKAQAQARANTILGRRARRVVDFSVEGIGIPDVISGTMVHIREVEMGINRKYYVDEDSHFFQGNDHIMNIGLTTTW